MTTTHILSFADMFRPLTMNIGRTARIISASMSITPCPYVAGMILSGEAHWPEKGEVARSQKNETGSQAKRSQKK
jgi:hypothetical protein